MTFELGHGGYWAGKKHSQATKNKMSLARIGVPKAPETIRKMTIAQRHPQARRRNAMQASAMNAAGLARRSKVELQAEQRLVKAGVQFQAQYRHGKYVADFFLPERNMIVEVYGCYWHVCQVCPDGQHSRPAGAKTANRRRYLDAQKRVYFERRGFVFKVIWEHKMKANP